MNNNQCYQQYRELFLQETAILNKKIALLRQQTELDPKELDLKLKLLEIERDGILQRKAILETSCKVCKT